MKYLVLAFLLFNSLAEVSSEFKGQTKSLINWQELDARSWLDLKTWKDDRSFRDNYQHWETLSRLENHIEPVGRVLECVGICNSYTKYGDGKIQYMSLISEGDEVQTDRDSYAWLFLFDGTMVRLAPSSSITFKEINITKTKVFHHARVNQGNVLWLNRTKSEYEMQKSRETDVIFYPLSHHEANPVYRNSEQTLEEYLFDSESVHKQVYERVNREIVDNNKFVSKASEVFLVLPNVSISGVNLSIDSYVGLGQDNYFKIRDSQQLYLKDKESLSFKFNLRGYANKEILDGEEGKLYRVSINDNVALIEDEPREVLLNEMLTKRIPTIYFARELMLNKYSHFLYDDLSEDQIAKDFGVRLWSEEEIEKRKIFLWTYMRRLETGSRYVAQRYRAAVNEKYNEEDLGVLRNDYYVKGYNQFILKGEKRSEIYFEPKLNSEKRALWAKKLGIRIENLTKEQLRENYYEEVKNGFGVE